MRRFEKYGLGGDVRQYSVEENKNDLPRALEKKQNTRITFRHPKTYVQFRQSPVALRICGDDGGKNFKFQMTYYTGAPLNPTPLFTIGR